MKRNMHKYEELFPDEFKAELQRSPIVYCSFSPVEYHGPHGTLGMDTIKGYEICLRAAEISGGIVFPMVPIAPSVSTGPDGKFVMNKLAGRNDIRKMASIAWPSIYISAEVCEKLFLELFESFAEDIGFKICVVMGSHGPAGTLAKKIAAENPALKGMKIIATGSLSHNQDLVKAEYARLDIPRISHGGMWESAMLMASNPEFVNPEKLKTIPPGTFEKWNDEIYGSHVRPDYEEMSKVSVEIGERLVQTAAERIAQEALQALKEMGSDNQNE
jgi:creatinine amidohydrolase/Fe(II)-dependent formamide hydrolase-like protein